MTQESGLELIVGGESVEVSDLEFTTLQEGDRRQLPNETYSGSFSFTLTEDNFREGAELLAALNYPVVRIDGEPYLVYETSYSQTD